MQPRAARLIERARSAAWTLPLVIITSLLFTLSLLLLYPYLGVRARVVSLPFVCFWGWRSGVWGGLFAGLAVVLVLPDEIYSRTRLPVETLGIQGTLPFLLSNLGIGAVVGRLSTLGRRLASELDKRIQAEFLLRESEECYRLLFDFNPHPMWVTDRQTMRFLAINSAALGHYGYTPEELDWMGLDSFLPPGDVPRPDLAGARRHYKKDGSIIDVDLAVHPITFRGREARLVLATDVTEQKRAQAALEHQAHHDALTGLPNRAAFRAILNQAIAQSERSQASFAVFLMDLDRFKAINDTLGHAYGDQTLQEIGPRLNQVLRPGDVLARLGGDEFGVFLPGVDSRDALRTADRLLEMFREPFLLDGRLFDVGSSLGIAVHPEHGKDLDGLLHRADVAMYASKRSRAGAVLYTSAIDQSLPRHGKLGSADHQGRRSAPGLLSW